jgi:hypothetical protein
VDEAANSTYIKAPESSSPEIEIHFEIYDKFKDPKCPSNMTSARGFVYDSNNDECLYSF